MPEVTNKIILDISKFDKIDLLKSLFDHAKPAAPGYDKRLIGAEEPLTTDEAKALLAERTNFDHIYGRTIRVDISGNEADFGRYAHINGNATLAKAIQHCHKTEQAATLHAIVVKAEEDRIAALVRNGAKKPGTREINVNVNSYCR